GAAPGERVLGEVAEPRTGAEAVEAGDDVAGELAEDHQHPGVNEEVELALEVGQAPVPLFTGRFVGRRGATDGGGDPRPSQGQAVVDGHAVGLVGVTGPPQGGVEPVPGAVAGEHPTGAVGAVGGGGQPDDDQSGGGVAEPGYRSAPVGLPGKGRPGVGGNVLSPGDQPGAGPASGDLVLQGGERSGELGGELDTAPAVGASGELAAYRRLVGRHGVQPTMGTRANSPEADHGAAGTPRPDPDDRRGAAGPEGRAPSVRGGPGAGGTGGGTDRRAED